MLHITKYVPQDVYFDQTQCNFCVKSNVIIGSLIYDRGFEKLLFYLYDRLKTYPQPNI